MMSATYPESAGHKGRDTGIAAAAGINKTLKGKRAAVFADLVANGPSTPEQIAARLNMGLTTARPRCSELDHLGLIEDSGERGRAEGGRRAIVWRVRKAVAS